MNEVSVVSAIYEDQCRHDMRLEGCTIPPIVAPITGDAMTDDNKKHCSAKVYGAGTGFSGAYCSNRATVHIDERWYCAVHSPDGVAKRKERQRIRDKKANDKYKKEWAERKSRQ